jgi:hypothetical protein
MGPGRRCNRSSDPRAGPQPLVASGMLAAPAGAAWLARPGTHTGYAAGVLGQKRAPSPVPAGATTAQAEVGQERAR